MQAVGTMQDRVQACCENFGSSITSTMTISPSPSVYVDLLRQVITTLAAPSRLSISFVYVVLSSKSAVVIAKVN